MIISHSRRFVFIKTTKTAGTSIEIALSEFCDDGDIITQLVDKDEQTRMALGFRGFQNTEQNLPSGVSLQFKSHTPGARARRLLGSKDWKEYQSFAFERNPWDRVVSAFHYMMQRNNIWESTPEMFRDYAMSERIVGLHKRGWGLYSDQNGIFVDKIFKFEELESAYAEILARINISSSSRLPISKKTQRDADYRNYYEDRTRNRVAEVFAKEIEFFRYSF